MGAFEGCFLKMENSERTMKASPKLMAADAIRLSGFIVTAVLVHIERPNLLNVACKGKVVSVTVFRSAKLGLG